MPDQPKLDPKVGEALCDDTSVVEIMQHPRMAEALKKLKDDPNAYHSLVKDDPELEELFGKLKGMMEAKEETMKEVPKAPQLPASAYAPVAQTNDGGYDVPQLQSAEEVAAETAKAEGTAAFESGDWPVAMSKYERVCALQPTLPQHWSNLAVARLRAGLNESAAEAARESTRLNPRFAKGWLRLGEALHETGDLSGAIDALESGLQRAEGAIRLALTKSVQKSRAQWKASGQQGSGGPTLTVGKKPSDETPNVLPNGWKKPEAGGKKAGEEKKEKAAAAPPPPPPPPPPKPLPELPTYEDEQRVAEETAALRAKTEDSMKRYAELAKQQTLAAAAARAKKAEAAKAKTAEEVVAQQQQPSQPQPAKQQPAAAAAVASSVAPKATASAAPPGARKVLIEEEGSDESDEEEEAGAAPVAAKAAGAAPAKPVASPSRGGAASVAGAGAEGMFAAALEQWSEGRQGSGTGSLAPSVPRAAASPPKAKSVAEIKSGTPALPGAKLPGMVGLSNDLIFDLA